jgi:hypothetical protein
MRGLSALFFILGISFFLNANDGKWAFTLTDRGSTYVHYDIGLGVVCWVLSYTMYRLWRARQEHLMYQAYLLERQPRTTDGSVDDDPSPTPSPQPIEPPPIAAHSAPAVGPWSSTIPPSPGTVQPPKAVRECPHCKEGMRRDASVCPHCRRDSDPWQYWEGRWWATDARGHHVWHDERLGTWRPPAELAHRGPSSAGADYDVIVRSVPDTPGAVERIARIAADETRGSVDAIRRELERLPATVLESVGYATAEGVRMAMIEKGAEVEVNAHEHRSPTPPPPLS